MNHALLVQKMPNETEPAPRRKKRHPDQRSEALVGDKRRNAGRYCAYARMLYRCDRIATSRNGFGRDRGKGMLIPILRGISRAKNPTLAAAETHDEMAYIRNRMREHND